MASRAKASKNAPGDKGGTSTRPSRLRVMHPDVEEVLRSPRRGRPKQQQETPQEGGEEDGAPARYDCAFQDEGGRREFAPPELVWVKVRSHPWWPGQVFDAADASELALQHARAGAPLVAYFWDKTFSWSDASALLPFRTNFTRLAGQSTMSGFMSAVDAALQEVGRRVEAGLSCACFATSIAKMQEIDNSGIREGAYCAVVDTAYMRDTFRGKPFLDYISALGKNPLAGADRLDLATARAQLRAFNRSRGPRDLPEFVIFEGIEDVAEAIPHVKRKRMEKSGGNDVPSKEKKSRCGESSLRKKEALPEPAKKVSMDEDSSMPSRSATDDALSKERKSKNRKSSLKKEKDTSKDAHGLETVDGSKMPAEKAVDDVLGESKSGRRLRSSRKVEDALEGLKGLGKGDGGVTLKGKDKDAALLKESKLGRIASSACKKDKITEDGDGLGDGSAKDSVSPGKRRSGRGENSIAKNVPISEHGRKKKKLSELMEETGRPNSVPGGKSKAQGKRSLHASTEKLEDPDRDSKDTVKTRKRKKLNTLGDLSSHSQPLSCKKSTKVGELMHKAAGQKSQSQTPPVLKANGAASQTRSHRAKHRQVTAVDKSLHSTKVNKGKQDALTEDSLSCGEMLSQLSLAARDLKKREKIAPTSVNFFTDFRKNYYASSSDVNEVLEKAANTNSYASSSHVDEEIPEKATSTKPTPSEQPLADHMQDDYWADILINVEEPLSSLRKKKDKGNKSRTSKKAHRVKEVAKKTSVSLGNAEEPSVEGKQDSGNGKQPKAETKPSVANGAQLNAGTKYAEEKENSLLAGLVLHFSRPSAIPSRSDLIKIFSQYGPVNEAKTEIANNANCAKVIFKRRMDAEAAFAGAGKISALGPALASFRLTDFPAAASGNEPRQGASKSE